MQGLLNLVQLRAANQPRLHTPVCVQALPGSLHKITTTSEHHCINIATRLVCVGADTAVQQVSLTCEVAGWSAKGKLTISTHCPLSTDPQQH